jgi:hypothetical protein
VKYIQKEQEEKQHGWRRMGLQKEKKRGIQNRKENVEGKTDCWESKVTLECMRE